MEWCIKNGYKIFQYELFLDWTEHIYVTLALVFHKVIKNRNTSSSVTRLCFIIHWSVFFFFTFHLQQIFSKVRKHYTYTLTLSSVFISYPDFHRFDPVDSSPSGNSFIIFKKKYMYSYTKNVCQVYYMSNYCASKSTKFVLIIR